MIETLTKPELMGIVWKQMQIRVSPSAGISELHALLQYKIDKEDLPYNLVNDMRDEIISFIEKYRNQLSLPCHGDCYQHTDSVVTFCYRQLVEDTRNAKSAET